MLDHTARRAQTTILGLIGTSDGEPEATLEELEPRANRGEQELLAYLEELTGRKAATIQKNLSQVLEKQTERSKLMGACDNKQEFFERILPFSGLLRKDTFGNYVIITPGSVYVTQGDDRRSTGTHYTPRSLTEPIVQHALDPLVYRGPEMGEPPEQWRLLGVQDILDLKVCDFAMGSGAFLVQACRYLAGKLVEAWEEVEWRMPGQSITIEGKPATGDPSEVLLAKDAEERLVQARRLVAERCLYGVDKNPMAVEMAKLSLGSSQLIKIVPLPSLITPSAVAIPCSASPSNSLRCGR